MENTEKDCCEQKTDTKQGIIYGLIPHAGCIAFIAGSILGVTVLTELFKPILLNRNFFYILIAISLGLATLSSALYLRKNGMLSWNGAGRKWKYLSVMYGSTIGANLLMFLFIFPALANANAGTAATGSSVLTLAVDIPCSGHATLISGELKTISGVESVKFSAPNRFTVSYDAAKTDSGKILALDVFKSYPASLI